MENNSAHRACGPLSIRYSSRSFSLSRYDAGRADGFLFKSTTLDEKTPLATALSRLLNDAAMPQANGDGGVAQVLVSCSACYVPLAEFQEDDCEAVFDACFPKTARRRVFYDVVASANVVVLFSLDEATCRTFEASLGRVNYVSALTPVLRHAVAKCSGRPSRRGAFVYAHDDLADVLVVDGNRLLAANTFMVQNAADTCYYALSILSQLGIPVAPDAGTEAHAAPASRTDDYTPIYIMCDASAAADVSEEMRNYAVNVCPVIPSAEYNRNIVTTTEGVPYDLTTFLLDYK